MLVSKQVVRSEKSRRQPEPGLNRRFHQGQSATRGDRFELRSRPAQGCRYILA